MSKTRWICHLIFNANGVVRMTIGQPALRSGERAVRIRLKVPTSAFARVFPEAVIDVPTESLIAPTVTVLPADAPTDPLESLVTNSGVDKPKLVP